MRKINTMDQSPTTVSTKQNYIRPKPETRRTKRQASEHPSIRYTGPRGLRQRPWPIHINSRRPLQSIEGVRMQPSKSTMLLNIQAEAARQRPEQPRMTHACSIPGGMVQNLTNYCSIGATARCNPVKSMATRRPTSSHPSLLSPQIHAAAHRNAK